MSVSVSDSGFKPGLPASEPYFTHHTRKTNGSWLGRLGSAAFQGEGVTGSGPRDDRELGTVEDPKRLFVARVPPVRRER